MDYAFILLMVLLLGTDPAMAGNASHALRGSSSQPGIRSPQPSLGAPSPSIGAPQPSIGGMVPSIGQPVPRRELLPPTLFLRRGARSFGLFVPGTEIIMSGQTAVNEPTPAEQKPVMPARPLFIIKHCDKFKAVPLPLPSEKSLGELEQETNCQ